MHRLARFGSTLGRFVAPALAASVLAYFISSLVGGDHGLRAYVALKRQVTDAREAYAIVVASRTAMEDKVSRLGGDGLDLDLLEERARAVLNYGYPSERVILEEPGE